MQERHQRRAGDRLEPQVAAAIAQAQQQGNTLSLIVLDVDEFRQINEMYGHDVGDQVLAKLSTIVEQQAGLPIVRWGGEEFAILCPEHNLKAAEALAERIRSVVANHSFYRAGTVTISLGVAIHQTGKPATDVAQRAIAATYQAKTAGKNRVIVG